MNHARTDGAEAMHGAIIMDRDRRIRVVSPGAVHLLGWRPSGVEGRTCSEVLGCQSALGEPLCGTCGVHRTLAHHEMAPAQVTRMADALGGRRQVTTVFWYLPPQ